jgi:hypothetical protein
MRHRHAVLLDNRSGPTRRHVVGALSSGFLLLVSACASGDQGGASDTGSAAQSASITLANATSLPLQTSVPPRGGDPQPPLNDITKGRISDQQAREIAQQCSGASEIRLNSECITVLPVVFEECRPQDLCIELIYNEEDLNTGYFEIVDSRPDRPLCGDGPNGLCFQLPIRDEAVGQLVQSALTGGSGSPTSSTGPNAPSASGSPASSAESSESDNSSQVATSTAESTDSGTDSSTPKGSAKLSSTVPSSSG